MFMKLASRIGLVVAVLMCSLRLAAAQMAPVLSPVGLGPVVLPGFGDQPVEISAAGGTRFEGGLAVAQEGVEIHFGEASIYADYAEYNPETREVFVSGNVRIYVPQGVFVGQRAVYNLETKQVRALELGGELFPARFRALSVMAPSFQDIRATAPVFTTDDSSEPSFALRARSMRLYPNDRVVLISPTLYVGELPVFWFPYLYANLDTTGFNFVPGYYTPWGGYLLTSYAFPLGPRQNVIGKVKADLRTERGFAAGFDADINFGQERRNTGLFESYYAWDQKPDKGFSTTRTPQETPSEERYRVAYKQTFFIADDVFAKGNINVLSDKYVLQDFFPQLFRVDPEPDTVVGLTKWSDGYQMNLLTRWQVNEFQQYTERLPEFSWEIQRGRLFDWPVYYSGELSAGQLRRAFAEGSLFPDYESFRFDTLHQLHVPVKLFGWYSIVPSVGFRVTFYQNSGAFADVPAQIDPVTGAILRPAYSSLREPLTVQSSPLNTPTPVLNEGGAILRPVFNFNIEQSFKVSKTYERIQARWLGLDGVRHVVQPYSNLSFVANFGDAPEDVLQFDRVVASTQLLPLTFPEFTAIDSIDSWSILRMGVRQSLQTRRNNGTHEWFAWDSFLDVNFLNPYSNSDVSNFFNIFKFAPVPWASVAISTQLPLVNEGFTVADLQVSYQPVKEVLLGFGMSYINSNPFFQDSNQVYYSAYWRLTDNWAVSALGQYEAEKDLLMYQRYMIHRDLSAWVASLGAQVQNNENGETNYGVLLMLTLKDVPQITLPFSYSAANDPIAPGATR